MNDLKRATTTKPRRHEATKVLLPVFAIFAIFVVFAIVSFSAQEPAPQSPAQPSERRQSQLPRFRGGANLVRVDAYPTLKGKPILDLTADDFEVSEDGVAQKVESFEFVQVRAAGAQEFRREPNSVRESLAMAESDRARIFVIYLDTYFTDIPGSHRIQRSLVNMLNKVVGEEDLFAVMTPDMSATDLALARRTTTIEGYLSKYWFWGQRGRLYPEDPIEQRYLECYPERAPGAFCTVPGQNAPTKDPDDLYSGVAQEMIQRRRTKRVLDGLTDLARYLSGLRDERKAVITISNGWLFYGPNPSLTRKGQCDPVPGFSKPGTTPDGRITTDRMKSDYGFSQYDCDTDRQMLAHLNLFRDFEDLMDIANAGNVSYYPVDSRGLAAFDRDLSEPILPVDVEMKLVRSRVESLRTLADNTDGIAIVDTNNLDKGFQRIVDDLTSYYLLGYYSTNTNLDGRVRKIKVRVKRQGVDVRARRSYKAATEEEFERGLAEMTAASAAAPDNAVQTALNNIGVARPGLPLRTAVSYAPLGTGRRAQVWTLAELDQGLLRATEWLGGGEVDVMLAAPDGSKVAQKTAPLAAGQRSISMDMGPIELPEGELVVRTRIKPAGEGLPVSDTIRIVQPAGPDLTGVPLLLRRGPTTGIKYVPTADKQFRRTDRVRLELPSADAIVATSAELLDRSGKALSIPVATGTRTSEGLTWATAEVALAPLAVGEYALRLRTEKSGKTNEVVTGFRIVP